MSATIGSFHPFLNGEDDGEADKALWAIEHLYQCTQNADMNVKVTSRVLERCLFLVKQLNSFTVMTHRRHGQQSRQQPGQIRYSWSVSFPFANITLHVSCANH